MKKLFINSAVKSIVDETARIISGVIGSTGIVDRMGDSVNPEGWKLENYTKNPVIMYAHDYRSLPIGKALNVYVKDGALVFDIQFADTDFAKQVFALISQKILSAVSVGFIPTKFGVAGQDEYTIMEQELLELSVVPVPANPEALAQVKSLAPDVFEFETKEMTDEEKAAVEAKKKEEADALAAEEKAKAEAAEAEAKKKAEEEAAAAKAAEQEALKALIAETVKEQVQAAFKGALIELGYGKEAKPLKIGEMELTDDGIKLLQDFREVMVTADKGIGKSLRSLKNIIDSGKVVK